MGFSRQEYWSGLPFPSPGDLPNSGTEPGSLALQADSLPSAPLGKPNKQNKQNHVEFKLLWGGYRGEAIKKKKKTERRKLERD